MTNNNKKENVNQEIAEIEAKFQSDLTAQEAALSGQEKTDSSSKNKYIIVVVISVLFIMVPILFLFNDLGSVLFKENKSAVKNESSNSYFIPTQFIGDEVDIEGKILLSEQPDEKSIRYKYSLYDLDENFVAYIESKSLDLSLSENLYVEISGLLSDQYNGVNVISVESITYR